MSWDGHRYTQPGPADQTLLDPAAAVTAHLIRAAAIDAIITGNERITRTELAAVQLDHAAEAHHTTTRPARSRLSRSAAQAGTA